MFPSLKDQRAQRKIDVARIRKPENRGDVCPHCGGPISVRNPSGYCDHLYYPEYCEVCQQMADAPEEASP